MAEQIKVLVVDDSAFMRKSLTLILESDPDIKVINTARDGLEGVELAKKLKPDIITLDIEMPKMDGLTALKKIMEENPTPVLMVSSLTTEGADSTVKAMQLGAVDFIAKEVSFVSVNIIKIKEDIIRKVKAIVQQNRFKSRMNRLRSISGKETRPLSGVTKTVGRVEIPKIGFRAIVMGISTGGPFSLQKIIPLLSPNLGVPIFLVQHMPPKFTKSLAERLNSMSQIEVKEAEDNETVRSNVVYIAPGGVHMKIKGNGINNVKIEISEQPADSLNKPSVDVMAMSVLRIYGKNTLGVIMTGMGRDGSEAIGELKKLGGYAIAQDEESCVVYGMPKAIVDSGYADAVLPLEKIPITINSLFNK